MQAKYGDFSFDANNVHVTKSERMQFARGKPLYTRKQLTFDAMFVVDSPTQALLKARITALEAALRQQGKDAGLYHDDGTKSNYFLESGSSIGGVKVTALELPDEAAIYATMVKAKVTFEADYAATSGADFLISFQESLDGVGDCGPRRVFVDTLTGIPQEQIVNQRTTQTVTQSGSAVGYLSSPAIPAPIFPGLEHHDRRRIRYGSPVLQGTDFIQWPVSWAYTFESAQPLFGTPNRR